jgi:hypothetical protein
VNYNDYESSNQGNQKQTGSFEKVEHWLSRKQLRLVFPFLQAGEQPIGDRTLKAIALNNKRF